MRKFRASQLLKITGACFLFGWLAYVTDLVLEDHAQTQQACLAIFAQAEKDRGENEVLGGYRGDFRPIHPGFCLHGWP